MERRTDDFCITRRLRLQDSIIIDNEHFLTIKLDEFQFEKMLHDEKIAALQYVVQLKNALEMNGAVVLVTREALKK